MRFDASRLLHLADPLFLHTPRQLRAEIQERCPRCRVLARAEQLDRVEAGLLLKRGADIGIHRREAARAAGALRPLEGEVRQACAGPIEPPEQFTRTPAYASETLAH